MKKLIVANWKMNPATLKEAEKLFGDVKNGVRGIKGIEIVVCPPFVYLPLLVRLSSVAFSVGGQDCFWDKKGAFTGEVSPAMLKNVGCTYVIIGHSERKRYFGETNEMINKKIKAALAAGLKVILCIGEDTRDSFDSRGRWTHELDPALKDQLTRALSGVKKVQVKNITVAYEPVWAIGTGNAAIPDDVLSAKIFIRKVLREAYGKQEADAVAVLYGGSTDRKNAASFIHEGQADGLLVGGSSLDAREFTEMVKSLT